MSIHNKLGRHPAVGPILLKARQIAARRRVPLVVVIAAAAAAAFESDVADVLLRALNHKPHHVLYMAVYITDPEAASSRAAELVDWVRVEAACEPFSRPSVALSSAAPPQDGAP